MSTKPASFPRRALIVKTTYALANGYSNAVTVEACNVIAFADGIARVEVRVGSVLEVRHVNTSDLASTPEKAAAKLAEHFAALLSRPLLSNVAGKTESTVTASSEK